MCDQNYPGVQILGGQTSFHEREIALELIFELPSFRVTTFTPRTI